MTRRLTASGVQRTAAILSAATKKSVADQQTAEKLKADHDEAVKERDDAFKALNKDQAEYDKQLLTLSAGFLGLSLAFIKDVIPLKEAAHLWELYLAFALMTACILVVLASYQYSIRGQFRVAAFWETKEEYLSSDEEEVRTALLAKMTLLREHIERHANRLKRVNFLSGCLFFLGVAILVLFVVSNIQRESRATSNPDHEKGEQSMTSAHDLKPQPNTPPHNLPSPPSPLPPSQKPSPGSYPKPPK